MDQRKKYILAVSLVIGLPILVVIVVFVVSKIIDFNNRKTVSIVNMSEYLQTNDYNKDHIERIENRLYETIEYNVSDDVSIKSLNILIRDGSYSEAFDRGKGVKTVGFIVDIESIKQSYGVKLEWDEEVAADEDSEADEWGTEVYCLEKDKLIYGEFNCKDTYTYTYGTNDPIIKKLPYIEQNSFSIYLLTDGNGNVDKIKVDIFGCMDKYATPSEEAANKWLNENIENLKDYKIEYTYCNGGQ